MKNSILVLVCVATLATMPGCFKDLSCSKKSTAPKPSMPFKTTPEPTPSPSTHASTLPAATSSQAENHPSSVPTVATPATKTTAAASATSTPTKA